MGNAAPPRATPGTNKSNDMMPLYICYYQVLKALVKNQIPTTSHSGRGFEEMVIVLAIAHQIAS